MILRTYKELREYLKMFRDQTADLLIIMSKGGYGKTSLLREVMKNREYVYINTHSTPLQTYKLLFDKQDEPVVFDDMDAILKNKVFVSMLKALADTKPIKELHYNTSSKLIGNAPELFTTASNVCLILNEFDIQNPALQPILDRGFYIEFMPSHEEIMNKITEIAQSQSLIDSEKCVLDYLLQHKSSIDRFSIRTYTKALQLFRHNPKTWKENFMKMIGFNEKLVQFHKLQDEYRTEKERLKRWSWSRATYFRVKQEANI